MPKKMIAITLVLITALSISACFSTPVPITPPTVNPNRPPGNSSPVESPTPTEKEPSQNNTPQIPYDNQCIVTLFGHPRSIADISEMHRRLIVGIENTGVACVLYAYDEELVEYANFRLFNAANIYWYDNSDGFFYHLEGVAEVEIDSVYKVVTSLSRIRIIDRSLVDSGIVINYATKEVGGVSVYYLWEMLFNVEHFENEDSAIDAKLTAVKSSSDLSF